MKNPKEKRQWITCREAFCRKLRLKAVFRSPFQRWWSDLKIEAMKKGDFFGCETNHHVQVPGDKCWVLRLQPNQLSGFSSSGTKKIQVYTKNSCQALLGVDFPLHKPYTYSLYKGEYLYLHFRYLECLVKWVKRIFPFRVVENVKKPRQVIPWNSWNSSQFQARFFMDLRPWYLRRWMDLSPPNFWW